MLKHATKIRILSILLIFILCIPQSFPNMKLYANADTTTTPTEEVVEPSNTPATSSPDLVTPDVTSSAAATSVPESNATADLRMIFTTDVHGNLTTTDYETGTSNATGTLARCSTLIKQARAEKPSGNTFLFDVGDQLYDYSTDYIYEHNSASVQPIYLAMKAMGYDAITLGNHEFDYNLAYIQNQISNSGLQDICVVSNVTYNTTKKNVWKKNMMLTRTVTLSDGSTTDIRIGIIGETQPGLSRRRTNYKNTLLTESIVKNTKKEAQELKEQGADIIVVLSHSGVGTSENPTSEATNVSYALTKIPEVDVVLCGHAHKYFPSDRPESSIYYKLSGIDKETGLTNGKNLIMVANKGASIGIADLTIKKDENNTVQIVDRQSIIRDATADVAVDEDINNNYMGTWKKSFVATYSNILGEISVSSSYNNYFATLEDNSIMQLLNDAKMSRALQITQTTETEYAKLPIIAASSYIKCGSDDDKDFVSFSDYFLESYLSNIQIYKTGIYLYKITGKQLREWMEWCASAYATTVTNSAPEMKLSDIASCSQTLLQKDWNADTSNFYVFDGVEYTIDTSVSPRYNYDGDKISDSQRISSITRNGVEITDTDTFVIATNKLSESSSLFEDIIKQKIYGAPNIRWRTIVKNYLEAISQNTTLGYVADNNWQVKTAPESTQIVKSSSDSEKLASQKEWITDMIGQDSDFAYYNIDMNKKDTTDTTGPNIIATPLSEKLSNSSVKVAVRVNDRSGIASIKYAKGKYTTKADVWNTASTVKDTFTCKENGIYSIYATDTLGNSRVVYVRITNINGDTISTPIVDTFTNRKTAVTGTASAKSTVYVKISGKKTYTTTAKASGKFSCTVPPQKSGTTIYVYAIDSSGRTSPRTTITVSRTGPNKPTLNTIVSNSKKITGNINDTFTYPIIYVEEKGVVYVPETDGVDLYKSSTVYDKNCSIQKIPCHIAANGTFTITLPRYFPGGTTVTLYTLDSSSRKSISTSKKIVQKIPPKPALTTDFVSNGTTSMKILCGERCSLYAKIDAKTYRHTSVTYDFKKHVYLYVINIPKTNTGSKIYFYALNSAGKSTVVSAPRKETVPNTPAITSVSYKKHILKGSVHFINTSYAKSSLSTSKTKVYVKIGQKTYKAKLFTNGRFYVKSKKIKKGTTIRIWATNVNGCSPAKSKKI